MCVQKYTTFPPMCTAHDHCSTLLVTRRACSASAQRPRNAPRAPRTAARLARAMLAHMLGLNGDYCRLGAIMLDEYWPPGGRTPPPPRRRKEQPTRGARTRPAKCLLEVRERALVVPTTPSDDPALGDDRHRLHQVALCTSGPVEQRESEKQDAHQSA